MRKQAREDLLEIRKLREQSIGVFKYFQKQADETVKIADEKVQSLTSLVRQASQDRKSIGDLKSEAENINKSWQGTKTLYSNASGGTATYFETPTPQSSLVSAAKRFLKDQGGGTTSLADLLTGTFRKTEP